MKGKKNKTINILIATLMLVTGVLLFNIISPSIAKLNNNQNENSDKTIDNSNEDNSDEENDSTISDTKDDSNKELFEDYYDKAEQILKSMTISEKVGQMFLVRYNNNVDNEIKNYYPCGYVLYAKDFNNKTKSSVLKELTNKQNLSKYSLVFAVDEEGGDVIRVSKYKNFRSEGFASPQEIYKQGGYQLLEKTEKEKIELLKSIGINLNLAPVADVSTNKNDYIYERSFGKNAKTTAEYIEKMVNYNNEENFSSTLKHFPGYGNNRDTHTGIAVDNRSYQNFLNNDYLPFISGINAKAPTILVSHNIINCLDKNYPATLSAKLHEELRDTLNFSGIIMTDDLAMDAVKKYVSDGNAATLAVNAGNDIIITSDFVSMHKEVMDSIKNGKIKEETIDKAVKRIIAWKLAYNIMTYEA